jgi:predicted nucleic acid-binding protein
VTVFVDSAVLMYAAGREHPLRAPSLRFLDQVADGSIQAITSVEVVQEILHRYISLRRPDLAKIVARDAQDMFAPVVPITHALMRRVPALADKYPGLQARDLVHVATCIHEGVTEIVSPDKAFDQVSEVRRIDPTEFAVEPA